MKRPNHETDLKAYQQIFNIYFDLIDRLNSLNFDQFEVEDLDQEKDLCRPKPYGKLPREYLAACDRAGITEKDHVTIKVDGFSCSFRLYEVIKYKRLYERKLITPRHHRYYIKTIEETKQVA